MQQTDNTAFELAASFVNHTGRSLFLTGKAGTGKTTFLRHIKENTSKSCVVVAPTGVAAINAGGVTMHSFFQLPFGPYLPPGAAMPNIGQVNNAQTLFRNIRFAESKRRLLQQLQLLIIDEVSMVRADMLDAMDAILRRFRKRPHLPFGGVQVLFIGDLYQLPPVAQEPEWNILQRYYDSPFFFDAQVLKQFPLLSIELKKVFRQQDQSFLDLLNKVRNNLISAEEIDKLNQRFNPTFSPEGEEQYITLSTHNYKAAAINQKELDKLPGKPHQFNARIEGTFQDNSFPADEQLLLKEGVQIMFIKNDKGEERRYYNGKIGLISKLNSEGIYVRFKDEEEEILLEQEEWENVKYSLEEETQQIKEEKLGKFVQYPIRLAWAITIHKSQGLTFDRAIIDAGSSFSAGQVYVALSRLTNMQGLVLHSRIPASAISCDPRVIHFMQQTAEDDSLYQLLEVEQQNYLQNTIKDCFDWKLFTGRFAAHLALTKDKQLPDDSGIVMAKQLLSEAINQQEVADKFNGQINSWLKTGEEGLLKLKERVSAAVPYFEKRMQENLIDPLEIHYKLASNWKRAKAYTKELIALQGYVEDKMQQLQYALLLADGLGQGMDQKALLRQLDNKRLSVVKAADEKAVKIKKEKKPKQPKGQTQRTSYELYQSGKSIEEIALERNLAITTIEGHLAVFIKTGELEISKLINTEKAAMIEKVIAVVNSKSLTEIMEKLGSEFTFGEIKWVLADLERRNDSEIRD